MSCQHPSGCKRNSNMANDPYSTTEQILVDRAQSGDEAAFTEILQRYKRPVLDFVYRMIGDPDAAQDVAQDVFVRVWRGISRFKYRRNAAFSTWVFQIARNACIDVIRRRARDPLQGMAVDPVILEQSTSPNPTATDVARREIGEQIAAAVASLPEDQRAVVVLAEYQGLAYKEIAAVMNCSVKSVEARLYRAKHFLRHVLSEGFSETRRLT